MEDYLTHEIELYSSDAFNVLLDHEVNRSRRYRDPLTVLHLAVLADPNRPDTQHSAEVFAINALNLQLRHVDIPCKKDNDFIILMPNTDETGGRIVCARLENLFNVRHQTYDRISFKMALFIGMASLPGDSSLAASLILHQASKALQRAREKKIPNTVVYSEIT